MSNSITISPEDLISIDRRFDELTALELKDKWARLLRQEAEHDPEYKEGTHNLIENPLHNQTSRDEAENLVETYDEDGNCSLDVTELHKLAYERYSAYEQMAEETRSQYDDVSDLDIARITSIKIYRPEDLDLNDPTVQRVLQYLKEPKPYLGRADAFLQMTWETLKMMQEK